MEKLCRFYQSEKTHYQQLSNSSQRLLLSFFVFTFINPLLGMVSTAFLFRESHNVSIIVLYNIALFIGIPLGYYINGTVLKRVNPTRLYSFGCLSQGLSLLVLLLFPHSSLFLVEVFGFIFGVTSGFFWSNKSLMTIGLTKSKQRLYFASLEAMVGTVASIIMPFCIGWFIVAGSRIHLYTPYAAYTIIAVVQLFFMAVTGLLVRGLPIQRAYIPKIHMIKVSKQWSRVRQYSFLLGLTNGIEIVLPTIMVLILVGKENSLGTLQAGAGVFVGFSLYQIAKKVRKEYRFIVFAAGVICSIIASLLFSFHYSALGVVVYFLINAFANSFRWTTYGPMCFDVIDVEERRHSRHRYSYIFDQQLFLNIGRIVGLSSFLFLGIYGLETALRISPLLFALPQLIVLFLMRTVEHQVLWEELYQKVLMLVYLREKELPRKSLAYIEDHD